mmetsp:Transcript_17015/g.25173  ORF Transcript_17015/g.25173 Transcript_17015/m.25173 type:complete len:522 (-) Transcript_17015:131-1696(-)|eukprot:CAMPEP_0194246690 /NCGR_PEP_ID=MMETSP0158-20130606/15433_1 /TAXON_ID=33649 /ORGANISM="Thalassionema nitzschioides, Strain L26-B" /LENGTH=521 /DNA_ID=CAMNT_0038982661 /DNA_START=37 /DNA_END=1602 /DNA_ORIENTATION=-
MRMQIRRKSSGNQNCWTTILQHYHIGAAFLFGLLVYFSSNSNVLHPEDVVVSFPSASPLGPSDSSIVSNNIPHFVKQNISDGDLNGIPVFYKEAKSLFSKAHCVGETFGKESWQYRSCEFKNLCYDLDAGQYVLFKSPEEKKLDEIVDKREDRHLLTLQNLVQRTVVLGAMNDRWRINAMKWFPRIYDEPFSGGYYEIPEDFVLVPFRSYFAKNPGHLLWDNFLPIFHLLSIFGLEKQKLLLVKAVPELRPFDYCDSSDIELKLCRQMFEKFLPVMNHPTLTSTKEINLKVSGGRKSNIVCARQGAGGLAMLADHGLGQHGKVANDYHGSLNVGRGPMIRMFRDYMMKNLGLAESPSHPRLKLPVRVVVSKFSSRKPRRSTSFDSEVEYLRGKFASNLFEIESHRFTYLNVTEQAEIASKADIMITQAGGGAITAMFLPPGSSLVVFYDEIGGFEDLNHKENRIPARLDFDLLNNAGYFKTHWLPTGNITEDGNLTSTETIEALESIIQSEVEWRTSEQFR